MFVSTMCLNGDFSEMMQESKLTNFQQRQLEKQLKGKKLK